MANTEIDTSEVDKLLNDLHEALETKVTGAKAGYYANDRGNEPYDEKKPPMVADVALWNEFGTERIPARPFLRTAQNKAIERGNRILQVRMEENADVEQIAKDLGMMMQDEIKKQITRGEFAPNAPSTIKRKGSSHPLIDTGNMRQSVHWAVTTTQGDQAGE